MTEGELRSEPDLWRARRDLNPGPLPKNAAKQFFSGVFPGIHVPRGKSNTDAVSGVTDALPFQDPNIQDLTELRAPPDLKWEG